MYDAFDVGRMAGGLLLQLATFFGIYFAKRKGSGDRALLWGVVGAFLMAMLGSYTSEAAAQVHQAAFGISLCIGLLYHYSRAKLAPSGWRRLAAVFTALLLLGLVVSMFSGGSADNPRVFAWAIAVFWAVYFSILWVASGFKGQRTRDGADA